MLVVTRKKSEQIVIGGNIRVMIVDVGRGKVKIGIDAPRDVTVHRLEVAEAAAARQRELDAEAEPGLGEDYA